MQSEYKWVHWDPRGCNSTSRVLCVVFNTASLHAGEPERDEAGGRGREGEAHERAAARAADAGSGNDGQGEQSLRLTPPVLPQASAVSRVPVEGDEPGQARPRVRSPADAPHAGSPGADPQHAGLPALAT